MPSALTSIDTTGALVGSGRRSHVRMEEGTGGKGREKTRETQVTTIVPKISDGQPARTH